MFGVKILLPFAIFVFLYLRVTHGHGNLMDPVNRSSAWRKGFRTRINYDDDELNCGGGIDHDPEYNGKCGVCGDPYYQKQPRDNENGGTFGKGVIVKTYKSGEWIPIEVDFSTNHLGYFTISLCPLNYPNEIETEECFAKYPLRFRNGSYKYQLTGRERVIHTEVQLPADLTCYQCVLRWHYRAGNNWGVCSKFKEGMGCGNQEIFRGCADIAIH